MGKSGDHRPWRPARRRSIWTVITKSQTGPVDWEGKNIKIPARATSFNSRTRAKKFASNIQGAKVSGPKFWTPKRVLFALAVALLLFVIFCR